MLKLIFDKDVNFFWKNNLTCQSPKVETLRMARYMQILCLSTLNLINQRNVSHMKLSKYCNIDARLGYGNIKMIQDIKIVLTLESRELVLLIICPTLRSVIKAIQWLKRTGRSSNKVIKFALHLFNT